MTQAKNYWLMQFAGDITPTHFPASQRLSSTETDLQAIPFNIPETTWQQLKQLTNDSDFLLYTALLTTVQICLYKYTRQTQIIVGSPVRKTDTEAPNFGNILPIAHRFGPTDTFRQCLLQVRQTLLDAYEHQQYPFAQLLQDLAYVREHSINSLFNVALSLTNIHHDLPLAYCDLHLRFTRHDDQMAGELHYKSALWSLEQMVAFQHQFLTLLERAMAAPQMPIYQLSLLTAAQQKQMLVDWNQTEAAMLPASSIHALFSAQAERTPAQIAVVCGQAQLSYFELNQRANHLAHYLQTLGVIADTAVGIYMERSIDVIVAIMAILKAGGAYLPLDPTYPKARLAQMLATAQADIVLTHQTHVPSLPATLSHIIPLDTTWEIIAQYPSTKPETTAHPLHLAYIIFTSGSTGTPKGVAISHQNLINYSNVICQKLQLAHAPQPLQFATASTVSTDLGNTAIFPALISGSCLHILPYDVVMDSSQFAHYMSQQAIDVLKIVPSHLSALLADSENNHLLPQRYLILGGEALTFDLVHRLLACNPACQLINHYGPTETTVGALTFARVGEQVGALTNVTHTLPIGFPIANTQAYVLDEQLQVVPVGVPGELYIGGAGVARGYLHQPAQTAARFIPNPFSEMYPRLYKTGDLVRYTTSGAIEFLGRVDHQIKIRGYRVELGEIEATLVQHPAIQAAVVLAQLQPPSDYQLVAYLVLSDGDALPEDLPAFLTKLPTYMIPQQFVAIPSLPLTPNGKVDRTKLQTLTSVKNTANKKMTPQTQLEQQIADIWQEVLGLETIGLHDNFFDLGGHSLLMIRVYGQLKKVILQPIETVNLFEHPTIHTLATFLSQQTPLEPTLSKVADVAQKRKAAFRKQQKRFQRKHTPNE